ncbi:hypothetical protein CPB85DRAFT_1212643 [Mucidula mucida]|nr:hypothetical protein CPB85DRAFT_1212643 [Mucidula mucida]
MWSASSAAEGSLLMKTILMYTSVPIEFHIICDSEAQVFVEQRLSLVTHPAYDVRVFFYLPSWQSMLDRVEREGSIHTDHSAGLPGLMKLFIHEIVPPHVKKGIYIDTDALFISDPALLWDVFSRLKPTTSIVMGSHPDQDSPEWSHASRICSCVMLLDLDKLRKGRLMDSSIWKGTQPEALSPPTFRKMYGDPRLSGTGKYANVRLGDQGYWWAIVDGRPDIFEPLSFDFEITSCLMDTYMIGLGHETVTEEEEMSRQIHVKDTPQEGQVILPKLLHFNCLHGTPIYIEWEGWSDPNDFLNERWGAAVRYHQGYKWIWLNKGKTLKTTLKMTTSRNMPFADERFALEHGITY